MPCLHEQQECECSFAYRALARKMLGSLAIKIFMSSQNSRGTPFTIYAMYPSTALVAFNVLRDACDRSDEHARHEKLGLRGLSWRSRTVYVSNSMSLSLYFLLSFSNCAASLRLATLP